jgi:hypothetical protein
MYIIRKENLGRETAGNDKPTSEKFSLRFSYTTIYDKWPKLMSAFSPDMSTSYGYV